MSSGSDKSYKRTGNLGTRWTGCGSHGLAKVVAKFQFQLLTAAFCLSEFFDPCLDLLHRFDYRAIKHLNIAFLGNVRFRVAQDALHHLVRSPISYRFEASPRRNACHPYHGRSTASRAGRITRHARLFTLM